MLSLAKSGQAPLFTDEELAAVVQTARDYGMTVAAHAHGTEGMLRAVRAGVHSIEHGTYMSDEVMTAMKEKGTFYVPTISAGRFVAEKAKIDGYFPAVVRPKAAAIGPQIQETFARAYKAGVKIAFGTDQGVAPHGDNALEFVYMVEGGMPPMTAIKSATIEGARLIGMEKELGTIEAGKIADLVAVPGDPIADIRQMTRVQMMQKMRAPGRRCGSAERRRRRRRNAEGCYGPGELSLKLVCKKQNPAGQPAGLLFGRTGRGRFTLSKRAFRLPAPASGASCSRLAGRRIGGVRIARV